MKSKFSLFLTLFLVAAASFLSAQDASVSEVPAENAETVYVIREVEFDIDGRSKPFALMSRGEFTEGERITGKENLDKYLARKTQLLINQRVLEDASIEYSLGAGEADGALPVTLLVHVKDSFNFVILPYPKYDSNDGLSITLKARDYNFLGTMSPLLVDLGYARDTAGDSSFTFSIGSDTPFRALGLEWNINFDNSFEYNVGKPKPLYYQNVTGLSVKLPWRFTTFTVGFNQYLTFNEEIDSQNAIYYPDTADLYSSSAYYGPYAASEVFTTWRIPLGLAVGDFGELAYTPGLSGKISYPYGSMDQPRKPVTTFSHSIGFGRLDWIGNYKKELSVSIGNGLSWYFDRTDAPLKITLDGRATFHWPFNKYIGVSSRLTYRQWWQWSDNQGNYLPYYSAGDMLRGVIDDDIRADYMLSFNFDIPIRILRFWPSEWFNAPKLHFFDFEMHFSPFIDMALIEGPYSKLKVNRNDGTDFSPGDMVATTGFEIIVFSGFFRSLQLRGSVGYNIEKLRKDGIDLRWGFFPDWDEIYIGLDYHY